MRRIFILMIIVAIAAISCTKEKDHMTVVYSFEHSGDGDLIVQYDTTTRVICNDLFDTAFNIPMVSGYTNRYTVLVHHSSQHGEASTVDARIIVDGVVVDSISGHYTKEDCYIFNIILTTKF